MVPAIRWISKAGEYLHVGGVLVFLDVAKNHPVDSWSAITKEIISVHLFGKSFLMKRLIAFTMFG